MKRRTVRPLIFLAFIFAVSVAAGEVRAAAGDAAGMPARYGSVREKLADSQFGQPIHLTSRIDDGSISGELDALIEHPFETVAPVFKSGADWCGIMMLHLNVKSCTASGNAPRETLKVFAGRKHYQELDSAYPGEYLFRVVDEGAGYFKVALTSESGPFRTRHYQILLEAAPVEDERTFIHFTYSYEFGLLARTAQSVYFNTVARDKVGFTVVDREPGGRPVYVDGLRGALERNIMRYYLAMKAYLDSLSVPPPGRLEKRLADWFDLTERYHHQLHEVDKEEYMDMKRREYQRLQAR